MLFLYCMRPHLESTDNLEWNSEKYLWWIGSKLIIWSDIRRELNNMQAINPQGSLSSLSKAKLHAITQSISVQGMPFFTWFYLILWLNPTMTEELSDPQRDLDYKTCSCSGHHYNLHHPLEQTGVMSYSQTRMRNYMFTWSNLVKALKRMVGLIIPPRMLGCYCLWNWTKASAMGEKPLQFYKMLPPILDPSTPTTTHCTSYKPHPAGSWIMSKITPILKAIPREELNFIHKPQISVHSHSFSQKVINL